MSFVHAQFDRCIVKQHGWGWSTMEENVSRGA